MNDRKWMYEQQCLKYLSKGLSNFFLFEVLSCFSPLINCMLKVTQTNFCHKVNVTVKPEVVIDLKGLIVIFGF